MSIRWFTVVLLLWFGSLTGTGAMAAAPSGEPAASVAACCADAPATTDHDDPDGAMTSGLQSADGALDGPDWASPMALPSLPAHGADPVSSTDPPHTTSVSLPGPDRPPRR